MLSVLKLPALIIEYSGANSSSTSLIFNTRVEVAILPSSFNATATRFKTLPFLSPSYSTNSISKLLELSGSTVAIPKPEYSFCISVINRGSSNTLHKFFAVSDSGFEETVLIAF